MKCRLLMHSVVILSLLAFAGCGKPDTTAGEYYCPMHPTYVSDHMGDCPICNMRLVLRSAPDSTALAEHSAARHKPGAGTRDPGSGPAAGSHGAGVPGMAPVTLDANARELAGIQTAVATLDTVARSIRTVGTVVPDETRVRHIHTRIDGYVEKLYVATTGQFVRKGEPVLDIYSPELLATQEEYLQAREAAARLAGSSIPEVQKGAEELKVAARRRLELFEVPESFIIDLERRGTAHPHVTMEALVSGYVTGKEVREGQHVTPGAELYTVTDLSRLWVEADFYENEASLVRAGQMAALSLPFASGRTLAAHVTYVYPFLEAATRTLKVRFDVPNDDLALKPSMYVDVVLAVDAAPSVSVPASAVLDSGVRKIVFVETQPNHFEPRVVEIGLRSADRVEVVSGVRAGEHVVVRANFLLDSESRLRGALSGTSDDHPHAGEP
ncbi:MAG TPA: efflux RND transporter periplasmic adaptor subunit [Candidatus Krumholzibacteria bacterium]|nr:efflux RND transporter periplasmic adaptor subunit [Candidatus Krumholzibacteria bacterium]